VIRRSFGLFLRQVWQYFFCEALCSKEVSSWSLTSVPAEALTELNRAPFESGMGSPGFPRLNKLWHSSQRKEEEEKGFERSGLWALWASGAFLLGGPLGFLRMQPKVAKSFIMGFDLYIIIEEKSTGVHFYLDYSCRQLGFWGFGEIGRASCRERV